MIRVVGCHREDTLILLVNGHAGFAREGNDIVCAGASALVHGLAGTLRMLDAPALRVSLEKGRAQISCQSESVLLRAAFYQALIGLVLLEQEYPKHIRVSTSGFFRGDDDDNQGKEIA